MPLATVKQKTPTCCIFGTKLRKGRDLTSLVAPHQNKTRATVCNANYDNYDKDDMMCLLQSQNTVAKTKQTPQANISFINK